jgi:hypothetical protein
MTISKAQWTTDGNDIRLSMPLSKVDQEKRIVSGFATLDNVDKQADIVTPEASLDAFKRFRGNIREMHQPISVGKMVAFKEEKFFDPETKKMYNGIYVSAYISKGAQDTWEKVLDGTLSGFSIGGRMNKWDDAYDEKVDSTIRIIKDYDLIELSLVDNPANQFANILSVQKADGTSGMSGIVADTVIENVFYDKEAGIVLLSEEESIASPVSGELMQNIGFVEKDDSEKVDMIKFLVDSAKGINLSKMTKEVSPMTEETTTEATVEKSDAADVVVENAEVAPEAEVVAEAPAADVEKSEAVEKSDDKDEDDKPGTEVTEEADDMSGEEDDKEEAKKSDDAADISKAVAEMKESVTSAFSDLVSTIKSMQEEISVLTKSLDSVKNEVTESKNNFNEFGKRVDAVEADTAFRKSGDIGDIVQEQPEIQVEKSIWGGRFLKTADLFK